MKRIFTLLLPALIFYVESAARELPRSVREHVDSMMQEGVTKGYYPGAAIAIGNRNGILYHNTYGYRDYTHSEPVEDGDVYDVASVTKIVATTFATMRLYDQGKIDINRRVGDYVDFYRGTPVNGIMLSQLLTHTSGLGNIFTSRLLFGSALSENLISYKQDSLHVTLVDRNCYIASDIVPDTIYISTIPLPGYRQAGSDIFVNPDADTMIMARIADAYKPAKRGRYLYSDLNFYILRQIIEKISGLPFAEFTGVLFDELGMKNTGYCPLLWKDLPNIIPTEFDYFMQRGLLQGYVHDDLAAASGGIEGNAGVFSDAKDLARFCEMMLSNGMYNGKRIISRQTVELFTSSPLAPRKIYRGLGFDKQNPDSPLFGGYGHMGYTGTMIWMDNKSDLFFVFLSNRVNPSRLNTELADSSLRLHIWEYLKDLRGSTK